MIDRKSTRLNSSHVRISYAVFCLKKKKRQRSTRRWVDSDALHRARDVNSPRPVHGSRRRRLARPALDRRVVVLFFLFFFKKPASPKISPLPSPPPFRC